MLASELMLNRRAFCLSALSAASPAASRHYHVCLSVDALDKNPELLETIRTAGVQTVWLAGFLYGHWYYTPERVAAWAVRIRKMGMTAEVVHVPLGHPGDSLGAQIGEPPLTPPAHWRQGVKADGTRHWGTSLHAPATEENVAAMRRWQGTGIRSVFLDDDFRLATGPGTIGGCHCDSHWASFRQRGGYGESTRNVLLQDLQTRSLTPLVRDWIDFHCSELTNCFRQLAAAQRGVEAGVMVMYLGAEKAGIRLADYRRTPFRVGELMFDDRHFEPVKGKADELFSALFHRRFAAPELSFSETTAFPADRLSSRNMAAKLAVSTLSDVRHTMFMSGLTPFPASHWGTLAPAMHRHAELHRRVAGLRPEGPLKHYWGDWSRMVGRDEPFSLFLALGVPFEVCDDVPREGWTFLSDDDAKGVQKAGGTRLITRRDVAETLPELFAWRRAILRELGTTPYVVEEAPVVCSWLRTARLALIWNLSDEARRLTIRHGDWQRAVETGPLALELVELGDPGKAASRG